MVALLLDNEWNPQSAISWAMPPTDAGEVIEWQFPDTAWTGFVDVDAPSGLVADLQSSISAK
eukprot:7099405-Pyramimonas_sp.AAC.1